MAIERTRVRMAIRTRAYWISQAGDIEAGALMNRRRRAADRLRRDGQRRREFAASVAALPGVTNVEWVSDELHVVAVLPGHVEAVVVSGSVELGEGQ
jgi:hypothetical protein